MYLSKTLHTDVAPSIQPAFIVYLPKMEFSFGRNEGLIIDFLRKNWNFPNDPNLSLQEVISSCKSFNKVLLEAYHAYIIDGVTSYWGSFELEEGILCDKNIFCTLNKISSEDMLGQIAFQCTLLCPTDQVYISSDCRRLAQNKQLKLIREHLTQREIQVIALIANGHTVKEIAHELFISSHTVESHKQKLYKKLKVKNTAELGKLAERYGLTTE